MKNHISDVEYEAKRMADLAWEKSGQDRSSARNYIHGMCARLEVSICTKSALRFCCGHDISEGEEYIAEYGGIYLSSFSNLACEVAYGTMYRTALKYLYQFDPDLGL